MYAPNWLLQGLLKLFDIYWRHKQDISKTIYGYSLILTQCGSFFKSRKCFLFNDNFRYFNNYKSNCPKQHKCSQRISTANNEYSTCWRDPLIICSIIVRITYNKVKHSHLSYLKCKSLKVKCVSTMPVVLTLVLSTSCSVGK